MTQREKLIELLEKSIRYADENHGSRPKEGLFCGLMADNLLANGVIVPPCKVGYTAYHLTTVDTLEELNVAEIFKGAVCSITRDEKNTWIFCRYDNGLNFYYTERDIGVKLFFSREEAEKAFAERSKE